MTEQELKQYRLDCRYVRMARIWAENSYCKRRQVGALVVKNKAIISDIEKILENNRKKGECK